MEDEKFVYIIRGDLWPEAWSGYVTAYYATLKEEDAQKYLGILKRKYPESILEVTTLPLDDTSCHKFLGGYGE